MPARVLVVGLDAAEATLVERWAAEGHLPAFERLARGGGVARLGNPLETLPGSIWPELATGRSGGKLARFYHSRKLHTGEDRFRPIAPDEIDASEYYWSVASEAGRRVAVVDVPQTTVSSRLDGIQLIEWGLHDRTFVPETHPPELLAELLQRFGPHPVESCDRAHAGRLAGYERLLDDLLAGAERKTELLLDLLGREHWDLFTCGFGETHCVGHQFWHFFAGDSGWGDAAPARLRDAIRLVYQRVDRGLGRLVEAAGAGATVLVVASHGMGPKIGGYQLLPELLVRLGLGSGRGATAQVRSRLPKPVRRLARRAFRGRARARLQTAAGSLPRPLESPRTRAITVPNNRCGAIRLNLQGREPHGGVAPGPEADALVEELRRELLALEQPGSGERIVERVVTAEEAFGPDHHPNLPDLIVVFRTDLGPLEACRSARVGTIAEPIRRRSTPRTGDHTVESRLWALGPGLPAGARLPDGNVLDLAPTVLRLLDVPLPGWLDGTPLVEAPVRA